MDRPYSYWVQTWIIDDKTLRWHFNRRSYFNMNTVIWHRLHGSILSLLTPTHSVCSKFCAYFPYFRCCTSTKQALLPRHTTHTTWWGLFASSRHCWLSVSQLAILYRLPKVSGYSCVYVWKAGLNCRREAAERLPCVFAAKIYCGHLRKKNKTFPPCVIRMRPFSCSDSS